MKYAITVLICFAIGIMSCKKTGTDSGPSSLEGSWKMTAVTDLSRNVVERKPMSVSGDVILRFMPAGASGGSFSGHTPSNVFGPDEYLLSPGNSLAIPGLTMTKVGESGWGNLFIENIRNASTFWFEYRDLFIQTPAKLLRFEKQ